MAIRTYVDTITANTSGRTYQVEASPSANGEIEPILITLSGTFASATCTLHVSAGATSPLIFAAASGGTFTAAGSHIMELFPGALFKFTITSSGSPQAVIRVQMRGQFKLLPA